MNGQRKKWEVSFVWGRFGTLGRICHIRGIHFVFIDLLVKADQTHFENELELRSWEIVLGPGIGPVLGQSWEARAGGRGSADFLQRASVPSHEICVTP